MISLFGVVVEAFASLLAEIALGHHRVYQLRLVDRQIGVTPRRPSVHNELIGVESDII